MFRSGVREVPRQSVRCCDELARFVSLGKRLTTYGRDFICVNNRLSKKFRTAVLLSRQAQDGARSLNLCVYWEDMRIALHPFAIDTARIPGWSRSRYPMHLAVRRACLNRWHCAASGDTTASVRPKPTWTGVAGSWCSKGSDIRRNLTRRTYVSFWTLYVRQCVAATTLSQALCALVFLYPHVLARSFGCLESLERPKRPTGIPVVLTRTEVERVLAAMVPACVSLSV